MLIGWNQGSGALNCTAAGTNKFLQWTNKQIQFDDVTYLCFTSDIRYQGELTETSDLSGEIGIIQASGSLDFDTFSNNKTTLGLFDKSEAYKVNDVNAQGPIYKNYYVRTTDIGGLWNIYAYNQVLSGDRLISSFGFSEIYAVYHDDIPKDATSKRD